MTQDDSEDWSHDTDSLENMAGLVVSGLHLADTGMPLDSKEGRFTRVAHSFFPGPLIGHSVHLCISDQSAGPAMTQRVPGVPAANPGARPG